jgi:hypothetical protein
MNPPEHATGQFDAPVSAAMQAAARHLLAG